jgi:RNA polymerase sigma factor (sigma-70 family)
VPTPYHHPVATSLSDDALLAGFAVGDPAASLEFVRRFQRRVFGLALRIVGEITLAQDVAQQAFEKAWRYGATYDPLRASVATWLLTITRNVAIDETRRRRMTFVELSDVATLVDERDAGPARAAEVSDGVQAVVQELATLRPEHRRAVVLSAWYGRTAEEIATLEGIPLGTAKTRIRDGVRRLRDRLATSELGDAT